MTRLLYQDVRPQGPLRRLQRHARPARQRRSRRRLRHRPLRPPRARLHAGSLAAALGGLDAFVFTAGIGENSAPIRARIAERLRWLGAELDPAANEAGALRISTPESRVALLVVPTDEELMIARHTLALVALKDPRMTLPPVKAKLLEGKKGLIVGIANDRSIAWGCARAFRALGADLAITYLNEKAKPHVEPLAREVEAPLFLPMDVMADGQLEAVFDRIAADWGALDFVVHSIAFSTKDALGGRVTDVPRDGFQVTMDVSVWSFLRMAHLAEPLMKNGGTLFTMTYYGSEKVVENYNIMGVAKAALEFAVRYVAAELGPKGIRVHAISPGPLATRAASGIPEFDALLEKAKGKAPVPRPRRHRRRRHGLRLPRPRRRPPDDRPGPLHRRRLQHHRLMFRLDRWIVAARPRECLGVPAAPARPQAVKIAWRFSMPDTRTSPAVVGPIVHRGDAVLREIGREAVALHAAPLSLGLRVTGLGVALLGLLALAGLRVPPAAATALAAAAAIAAGLDVDLPSGGRAAVLAGFGAAGIALLALIVWGGVDFATRRISPVSGFVAGA